MKQINIILFILQINLIPLLVFGQDTQKKDNITPQKVLDAKQDQSQNVNDIASPLFDPVKTGTPPKPNPFPTKSINEKALDVTFGSNGINIEANQLRHLKICYLYFEYIVKLELAAQVVALARTKNIDVLSVLESTSWKALIDQLGGWDKVKKELAAIKTVSKNDWESVRGSIEIAQWQDLVETSFWQTISVTSDILLQSQFWQNYAKYAITQAFDQDGNLLDSIYNVETRIFMYIPNIEVAYYNEDFSYLRNSSEYFRLTLVLTDAIKNRLINQISEWKQYYDPKTNNLDLVKTYDAAEQFKNTIFYKIAALANQDFSKIVQQAASQNFQLKELLGDQKPGPLATEEIICLAMIKNMQAQLHYLFDSKHLEKTMKVFANKAISKPIPNILLYEVDDHLYLEDLAMVVDRFSQATKQNEKVTTQALTIDTTNIDDTAITVAGSDDEKVEVQGIGSWVSKNWNKIKDKAKHSWGNIKKAAKTTWKDIQKLEGDLEKLGSDVLQGIKDESSVLDQAADAFGALMSHNPQKAAELIQNAVKLQQKVADDVKQANKDVQNVIDDTVQVAKDTDSIVATAMGDVVGLIDSRLGKDITKSLESAAALLINVFGQMAETLVVPIGAMVELTADAAAVATKVVTSAMMDIASGNFSQLGTDVLNGIETMIADVASTLWTSITFIGKYIIKELADAVSYIGAMIAYITDFMVDTFAFATRTLGALADSVLGWKNAEKVLNNVAQEAENHRRTVAAAITTVLLVGAVILTDGAAIPLIALTVGPQLFQVVGSFQQDQREEQAKKDQKQFLQDYKTFVDNNEKISTNAINAWSNELTLKYQSQVINEERELGFYQNFLNRFFESTENQMSFYLGTNLAPQLMPDKEYALRGADVGALYGIKTGDDKNTGVLNLNPSQGFPLYNDGRQLYSQEIAVYPALSMQLDDDQTLTTTIMRKFWFNQKETIPLDKEVNEVEVRFQVIYALNMFNIGLYFGGDPVDVQNIVKEKEANVDAGHLAKMLVYNKENKNDPVALKLYEHEGQGWFKEQPHGPAFEMGTWYHMKMQLNQTTLQTKVWKEGDQEPSWQSFTVKKTSQKTLGMISSGASIQYKVVSPQITVTPVTKLRTPIDWQTEKTREKYQRQNLQLLETPKIGKFNLAPTDKTQILKGQYIYTTKATNLKNDQQQVIDDYVILGNKTLANKIENLGASPMQEIEKGVLKDLPNVAITSLVTGDAYDQNGNRITTCANVLNIFLQAHGPLTAALTKTLKTANQAQQKAQLGPFKFGTITLNATSASDVQQGLYIYQALSPEKKLQENGKPIKDKDGNTIYDYFIAIDASQNFGAPYSASIQTIRSLVTGNQYGRKSNKPTDSGYHTGQKELANVGITNVPSLLAKKIDDAATFYAAQPTKESKGGPAVQQTGGGDINDPTGPHSVKQTDTGKPLDIKPAEKSLQDRGKKASGNGNGGGLAGWGS